MLSPRTLCVALGLLAAPAWAQEFHPYPDAHISPAEWQTYLDDVRSNGFWPGEGCGFAVLMRLEDATREGRLVHAVIRGWGISSDGAGGITRPEADGQRLALQ